MTPTVQYLAPAGLNRTVAWQRYYLLGLDEVATVRWSGPPVAARLLPGVDRKVRLVYRLDGIRRRTHRAAAEGHVGRYVARLDGETVRFAIDAHDGHTHVRSDDVDIDLADEQFVQAVAARLPADSGLDDRTAAALSATP